MNSLPTADSTANTWDQLADQWQGTGGDRVQDIEEPRPTNVRGIDVTVQDLARRVRRQSHVLWLVGAAELVVCLLTLLLATDFAFGPRRGEPWSLPTAAGLALLVFVAGRQAWSTRRGLWTAAPAHDHAGYLQLLQRRLVVREQGLVFSSRLTVVLFVAFCVWLPLTRSEGLLGGFVFLVFWCSSAAFLIAWLSRRARRERDGLAALHRALHGTPFDPPHGAPQEKIEPGR